MELVKIAEQNKKYFSKDFIEGFDTGVYIQYQRDAEEATNRWIPCKERLPIVRSVHREWVWINSTQGVMQGTLIDRKEWMTWRGWPLSLEEVDAWMPIYKPQPYKEE